MKGFGIYKELVADSRNKFISGVRYVSMLEQPRSLLAN